MEQSLKSPAVLQKQTEVERAERDSDPKEIISCLVTLHCVTG